MGCRLRGHTESDTTDVTQQQQQQQQRDVLAVQVSMKALEAKEHGVFRLHPAKCCPGVNPNFKAATCLPSSRFIYLTDYLFHQVYTK